MQARATYEQGRERNGLALSLLESRSRRFATARLLAAALALALVGGIVWWGLGRFAWIMLALLAGAFALLVVLHARVHESADRARAGLRFHTRGLARLNLAWDDLPTDSGRFLTPEHPFGRDLDVFGRASLMQIIDATETRFGEERLAALLAGPTGPHDGPHGPGALQEAARDLSTRSVFRERLAVAGAVLGHERPNPATLLGWAEERDAPLTRTARILPMLTWLQPALVVVVAVFGLWIGLPASSTSIVCGVAIAVGLAAGARFAPTLDAVSARESTVTRWRIMIAAIEQEPFAAALLVNARARLDGGQRRASDQLRRLETIVGFVDARRNEVFRFLLGPLCMWDVHCACALRRWRADAGPHLRAWLECLADVEALASVGGFAFEHPEFSWPELTDRPMFEGRALGHPLLPADRRVGNDVRLPANGRALVVTGSNMSGKSTLLRAVGVNTILAFAGAPVCAAALRVGPLRVATSMRVEDSLEQGVSHFYAELRRLKGVIDLARDAAGAPVLFLLDEILHGTNSRERIIGACAVVRELLTLGALGAVSTHDLGITSLDRQLPGQIENAHFEEQVKNDAMTFDYVLRPGIVQSSNALRLMRAVGIDVRDDECP